MGHFIFYLIFLVFDAVMCRVWLIYFRSHKQLWRVKVSGWRVMVLLVSAALLFLVALLLAGLIILTLLSFLGNSQEGYSGMAFLMSWLAGLFICGIGLMIIEFLHSLLKIGQDGDENDRSVF